MKRLTGSLAALALAIAATGCIASTVVLHVSPDGRGRAVVTMRLYESGLRAFDSMFPESPKQTALDEELPAPSDGELARAFGVPVTLVSSKLDKAPDGLVRTSVVEFPDIAKIHLPFPPLVGLSSGMHVYMTGMSERVLITFAMKRHDNGNRLLLVRLPDERIDPGPEPEMTVFKTDSAEEQAFKRAIKNMALRLYVEFDDVPLLRTNAPRTNGSRATILDLDLDKVINNLDEQKVRRAMTPGSMQEVLWQLGDMPGAVVPTDHEVFLEFEGPQAQQPPPAPASAQAPPDTEIYLAPLKTTDGAIDVGPPVNITNNPGYDNQPFFTPDGAAVLFTSVRGGGTQTDIYRFDIPSQRIAPVTNTPESEYSPTVTPSGALSVIRVELDGSNTQRLWQFTIDGRDPRVVLENVKPVGYHAWADDHTLALFVLGQPATLQLADSRTGAARTIASDIGRAIQRIPGAGAAHAISFVQRERAAGGVRLLIKKLDPATGGITTLTPAVDGATEADTAWMPDGSLLMVRDGSLYLWRPGQSGWKAITTLERLSLSGVTRLAVSPKGDYLALVGAPRQSR